MMTQEFVSNYLADALQIFRNYKKLAERTTEQASEEEFFRQTDAATDPRATRRVAIVLVVLLLAVCIACNPMSFADDDSADYGIKSEVTSPDGQKKALVWNVMGGGAAGWCFQFVSVLDATDNPRFDAHWKKTSVPFVFQTACRTDSTAVWIDSRLLKISYRKQQSSSTEPLTKLLKSEKPPVEIVYEVLQ